MLKWTRIPVCEECLRSPEPLSADYYCTACNTPFANAFPLDDSGLCTACRAGLIRFDRAACFGFYEGTLRTLVHLYKYAGMRPLARHLAGFMQRVLPPELVFDVVVPVPLHWRKQWDRGFNQAELLARQIASRRGLPVARALRRKRATAVQASLASAGRRRNVAGAFAVRDASRISGARVLLIDDVMTTGATANACATALKSAGAKSITLLTLARVDRRWRD